MITKISLSLRSGERGVLLLMLLLSCSCPKSTEPEAPKEDEHGHEEDGHEELPKSLRLTAEEAERAGIRTEPVKRLALSSTVVLTGEVVAQPDRSAKLSASTPGRLESVSFNEGSIVKRGDVMAVIRVPDVGRLRGAYAAAAARAKAARSNAERFTALKNSGLGADQALLNAEADARAQEAEARALGEQLAALGVNADSGSGFLVSLRAPLSGVVVMRDAVLGQPIGADHVLASIVDLSEVWFLGRVFEKDLEKLRVGARADVQLNAFPGSHFKGTVDYVSQQIDPTARTLTARVRVVNDGGQLRLGLFGRASIELSDVSTVAPQLVVPRDSIVEVGAGPAVFIKAPDGDFVLHEVKLGESAMGDVQVLSGVSEGEQVVVSGVFTLKSLLLKSTLSEDE
jgi:cobalt-zinc-cadmium efflux system membrane fusion protein